MKINYKKLKEFAPCKEAYIAFLETYGKDEVDLKEVYKRCKDEWKQWIREKFDKKDYDCLFQGEEIILKPKKGDYNAQRATCLSGEKITYDNGWFRFYGKNGALICSVWKTDIMEVLDWWKKATKFGAYLERNGANQYLHKTFVFSGINKPKDPLYDKVTSGYVHCWCDMTTTNGGFHICIHTNLSEIIRADGMHDYGVYNNLSMNVYWPDVLIEFFNTII